jgi:hypothetical protein
MRYDSASEVVWEGEVECVLAKFIDYPVGESALAIIHTVGNAEDALRDWHPEDTEDEMTQTLLTDETAMNALCLWWLEKHPELVKPSLTEEERTHVNNAMEFIKAAMPLLSANAMLDAHNINQGLQRLLERTK